VDTPARNALWRRSSFSHGNGACVEVTGTLDAVRDSKNPNGEVVTVRAFAEFVDAIKADRFAR
jgi:hypothetical protein